MKHSVEELVLKNGARGLIIKVPDAQVVNLEIDFRAGEYLVDPKKWEVPHLMEHTVLGANVKYPKARLFQAEIEKNGAYTNASTGTYDIIYEAECADFEWQRVLDLLLIAISKPLFLESEFKAEFGNVKEELLGRSNNYFRELSLRMRECAGFVAKSDKERLKLMKNVDLEDIKAHWRRTHGTNNMRFVIGGNITPSRQDELIDLLEKIDLPKGRRFELPNEVPKRIDEPIQIQKRSIDNMYIYLDTFSRHRINDSEVDALGLANTLLTETLYSKILGTAREQGLIYDMGSGISVPKSSTNWWFGTQVSLENAPRLIDLMISEISKVLKGELDEIDIESAKQYSLGRFQRGAQTVGSTVGGYSSRYFFDGVVDDYYRIPERIKAVTKEAITESAKSVFKENIWVFGELGRAPKDLVDDLYQRLAVLWQS